MPVRIVGVDAESEMRGYLHVGDIIVRLGDIEVVSPQVLRELLHDWPSSGSLRLTVIRDHHTVTITAPLPAGRALGLELAHAPDRRAPEPDRRSLAQERRGAPAGRGSSSAVPPTAAEAATEAAGAAASMRAVGTVLAAVIVVAGAVLAVVGLLGTCPDGSSACLDSVKGLNVAYVVFGVAIACVGAWLYLLGRAIAARLRLATALAEARVAARVSEPVG